MARPRTQNMYSSPPPPGKISHQELELILAATTIFLRIVVAAVILVRQKGKMAAKLRPLQKFVASLNGQKLSKYAKCKQIVQCSCGGMQRRTIQNHSTVFVKAPEQNINWKPPAVKCLRPLEQRRSTLSSYLAQQLATKLPARCNSSDKQTGKYNVAFVKYKV